MGVFWDVFWAVACICGLAFVGWWLFGLLLRPLPGRTVRVVLTGRDAPEWLLERADYITVMEKRRHPYDRGIAARPGIEE